MRLRKYGKKTVSVILACGMLGTSFAQCAFAEDAAETDVVVEQETQAAEVEEVGETQQESVTDAADEFVADELSAEDAETAEDPADIADEQDGDDSDEISLTVTDIETVGPMVTAYATATSGDFRYEELENGGVRILGPANVDATPTDLSIPSQIQVTSGEMKDVKEIGDDAFKGHSHFTGTLTLPNSLTKIGANAFSGCKFTGKLELSGAVEEIGDHAFEGCCFTGALDIPSNLTIISDGAFKDCESFTGTLTIKNGVTSIGLSAFENCKGFDKLLIQAAELKSIGPSAFEGCSGLAGDLIIPSSVNSLGESAFKNCGSLTSLDIEVTSLDDGIGKSTFEGCTNLNGPLDLSDTSATIIGEKAFYGCEKLTSLLLPDKLKEIGDQAFEGCTGFTGELELPTSLESIGMQAFLGCNFEGELNFSICSSLKQISEKAFYNCVKLTGDLDLSKCDLELKVGKQAFGGCNGFEGVLKLPTDNIDKEHIAADAFFDGIVFADGNGALELQEGSSAELKVCAAENNKLMLDNALIDWTSGEATIASAENGTVEAKSAGTATIIAKVKYCDTSIEKEVIVNAKLNSAPTIEKVEFTKSSILKPGGEFNLEIEAMNNSLGIKGLSGYFCLSTNAAQKISFSYSWSTPAFTKQIPENANDKDHIMVVKVPSTVANGEYYLGGMTVTGSDGKATTYTYDTVNKVWKNGNGRTVNLVARESQENENKLLVKDKFELEADDSIVHIANTGEIENRLSSLSGAECKTAAVILYDASNHTAKSNWFEQIENNDVSLVLTNGIIAWAFYGKDIKDGAISDLDCLATLAAMDTSIYGNPATSMAVQFAKPNVTLPGKATIRLNANYMNGLYQQIQKIYMYTVNADATLTKLDIPVSYVYSGGQYWYEFELEKTPAGKLLMSSKELSLKPSYKVTSITLSATSIAVAKGKKVTLAATAGPVGAANKAVVWTSSNKKVAKVSTNGVVTGKKYGTATITATAADGSGVVAKCTVRVGYKIKYKLNGGKNNAANPKAYYNQKVKLKTPTRPGYTFKGWYTDKNFKHSIKKIKKSYKKNLTLYAKWKKN